MNNEKDPRDSEAGGSFASRPYRDGHQQTRRSKKRAVHIIGAVLLLCVLIPWYPNPRVVRPWTWVKYAIVGPSKPLEVEDMIFDFNDITPSEKLQWHPCFYSAQCARLTVPMDYNRPLNASRKHPKVHIALAMIPGAGHSESGNYSTSPLLLNPGGPGGAGASFALGIGGALQSIVSTDRTQDIVGFDPRGIGATTPQADCWSFPADGEEVTDEDVRRGAYNALTWALLGLDQPLVNVSEGALVQRDSSARAAAKLCSQHDYLQGEDSILRHVSTPAVAQDMLSIIDAWDEWRNESGQVDSNEIPPSTEYKTSDESTYSLNTKGKLVYWGFSYGTLLGATFAAMFPNRVGRVVLDGVVDADRYVSPIWAESLYDTDSIEDKFHEYCHKAGPACALYHHDDTIADIKARFDSVVDSLKTEPFSGVSAYQNLPFVLSYSTLKSFIFGGLYSPISSFPYLADLLAALYAHDSDAILSIMQVGFPSYEPFCDTSRNFTPLGFDAQLAIMCTDKRYPLNESIPNLEKRFATLAKTSRYADVWMSLMIGCDAYDIKPTDPPMRWDDHPSHRQSPIKTSYPLMFVSNTRDPVTPLYAGVKMARKFVDAGLLEQRSEGHCSIAAVSFCSIAKIRKYFEEGTVPPRPHWGPGKKLKGGKWEICEADEEPWNPYRGDARWDVIMEKVYGGGEGEPSMEDLEEMEVVRLMDSWKAVQDFARPYFVPRELQMSPLASHSAINGRTCA